MELDSPPTDPLRETGNSPTSPGCTIAIIAGETWKCSTTATETGDGDTGEDWVPRKELAVGLLSRVNELMGSIRPRPSTGGRAAARGTEFQGVPISYILHRHGEPRTRI